MVEWSTSTPRSSMSSSTWRVLSGYATYQRTPLRMTSLGKWAPLQLTAIVASLMRHRCSQGRIIPQIAPKKNCDTTSDLTDAYETLGPQDHLLFKNDPDARRRPWLVCQSLCLWTGSVNMVISTFETLPACRKGRCVRRQGATTTTGMLGSSALRTGRSSA